MTKATGSRPFSDKPRRRGSLAILIFMLAFLAALWGLYWYGAREIAAAALDRALARAEQSGLHAGCENPASGGFPLDLALDCGESSLAGTALAPVGGTGGWQAIIPGLSARAPLYWPGRVETDLRAPLQLDIPGHALSLTAEWDDANTTVEAGLGGLQRIAAWLAGFSVRIDHAVPGLVLTGLATPEARFSLIPSVEAGSYRLAISARSIAMETSDERDLPRIELAVDAEALDFGTSLGMEPRRSVQEWAARSGRIKAEKLAISAGDFSADASGLLQLSANGLLSGTLTLTMRGIAALPDVAEAFRPGSRERVVNIAAGMTAFTKPVETPDGPAQEATLILRDGVVSLGIFPIGMIPPIRF